MDISFEQKQGFVLGLVLECPFQEPLPNCPAADLRNLPVEEKLESIKNMSEQALDEIIEYHRECTKKR